jgi:hypothetical protein
LHYRGILSKNFLGIAFVALILISVSFTFSFDNLNLQKNTTSNSTKTTQAAEMPSVASTSTNRSTASTGTENTTLQATADLAEGDPLNESLIAEPQPVAGFNQTDVALIKELTNQSANFLQLLQTPSGAIPESMGTNQVFVRDLSLSVIALLLANRTAAASSGISFLLSLQQGSSYFTTKPANAGSSSRDAWFQVYSTNGSVVERSLRGEDQGIALFALATYYKATGNLSSISAHWQEIQNSANFILYLQNTPGEGRPDNGLYRHGDNWQDTRQENTNSTTGKPIYWPYWPEYYQWEEENMRMIMGLKGAVLLATTLGHKEDAKAWNNSVNIALKGLNNESIYNKYEAYDYFGSVLWGLQTNLTQAKDLLSNMPSALITPYGIKDLPTGDYVGSSDTMDYMTVLVRVGDYANASYYLNVVASRFAASDGGFYDALSLSGVRIGENQFSYSAARFVYFESIALNINRNMTLF